MSIDEVIIERLWSIITDTSHTVTVRRIAESEYVRLCDDYRKNDYDDVKHYIKRYVDYKMSGQL